MHLAHWSIAQTKNRETEASGIGWELFLNYRIARDKYQPDFFLYENNKSMSPAIRTQITAELGVGPVLINSALVSAQNRQRLYWVGRRNQDGTYSQVRVEQPVDRGILLRDILETGTAWRENAYTLKANYSKASDASYFDGGHFPAPGAAESVRIGAMPNKDGELGTSQSRRIYSTDGKSVSLQARPNGGGADGAATGLYAVPAGMAWRGKWASWWTAIPKTGCLPSPGLRPACRRQRGPTTPAGLSATDGRTGHDAALLDVSKLLWRMQLVSTV